jgi:hypothetical protein
MRDNKGKRIAVGDKYNGVDILTILHFHGNTVQNLGLKQLHIKSMYTQWKWYFKLSLFCKYFLKVLSCAYFYCQNFKISIVFSVISATHSKTSPAIQSVWNSSFVYKQYIVEHIECDMEGNKALTEYVKNGTHSYLWPRKIK